MKIRPGLELASLTDVGCKRENNEDSYAYWEPGNDADFAELGRLAILADGMGGHEGGQIASRLAVETFINAYAAASDSDPQKRLLTALKDAHRCIQQRATQDPGLSSMGTTCTALALIDSHLYFVHVGDSRLYLLREGKLQILSRDHTLIARLLEKKLVRPDQVQDHPQKHVLTSALGISDDEIEIDAPPEPLLLHKGDILMICTDGLWGQMESWEIKQALASESPDAACRFLVHLAKERGGPDNITLQVLRIG
ncbi:MAG TPA: protein phosphatase 2C domain-containing protein [Terriglobales bacterium]|jgi:serine/threonine protein phosphatase PrpC|nr:protein phosphatase 2C domain-containing protein [Terriglobales bacterium]